MRQSRKKRTFIILAVILLVMAAYMFFSRPMTIQQLYPTLSLEKCIGMEGYYRDESSDELQKFTIDKNSEEFDVLCDLLYKQEYRRSVRDLLPAGTRVHATKPGDFEWEVFFCFEDVELSDGNIGSGGILRIQSWYGELDLYFDGGSRSCYTKGQDIWARQVLDIIR